MRAQLKIELTKLESYYNKKLDDASFNEWIDQFIKEKIAPGVLEKARERIIKTSTSDFMPSLPKLMNICMDIRYLKNRWKKKKEESEEPKNPKLIKALRLETSFLFSGKTSEADYIKGMKELGMEKEIPRVLKLKNKQTGGSK